MSCSCCSSIHLAQTQRVLVPVGAHVKIDPTQAGNRSKDHCRWRGDTLLVQPNRARIRTRGLRRAQQVARLESPRCALHQSSTINFFFSTTMPRAHDSHHVSDAYERLLLVGNKTELAGINTATGRCCVAQRSGGYQNVSLDIAGTRALASFRAMTRWRSSTCAPPQALDSGPVFVTAPVGCLPSSTPPFSFSAAPHQPRP